MWNATLIKNIYEEEKKKKEEKKNPCERKFAQDATRYENIFKCRI